MKKVIGQRCIRSLLIVSMLSLAFFGGSPAFASTTEHSNSTSYPLWGQWIDTYASSSIEFVGADWSYSYNRWVFVYKYAGTGASRYQQDGDSNETIENARMTIKGTSNTSNLSMWSSADPEWIGSAPSWSGGNPDYSASSAVVGFAITAINNIGASYIWSSAQLVDALRSTVSSESSPGKSLERFWAFPTTADNGQFFWFDVKVNPNETVQISHEYEILGPGFEHLSAGKGYRNLNAPGPDNSAYKTISNKGNWHPRLMSAKEKEKHGIVEIPREQLDKRAAELNIPDARIREFKNTDEDVFYFAHSSKILEHKVDPSELIPESPKEALVQEINNRLERSELIIEVFSNKETVSAEHLKSIKKHKERKAHLEELLSRTENIKENDTEEINALLEELKLQ